MAKTEKKPLVDCCQCVHSPGEIVNIMLDCNNKVRNPKGFKVGSWPKECQYFKQK